MKLTLDVASCLPEDGTRGLLVGRAWIPAANPGGVAGPGVVVLVGEAVHDVTHRIPTIADLLAAEDPVALVRQAAGDAPRLGAIADLLANSSADDCDPSHPYFLAPADLQAMKACGVTFATSMIERVIEEKAKGDPDAAEGIRATIAEKIGSDLGAIVPGSAEATRVKQILIERGLWSAYLEVGIGPDAEVFTKCPPMASVGVGAEIGVHPASTWNNPEPEIVMVVSARGVAVGATLGNDVNLRDVEGRSALLLGKAKDNNASSAVGPFIRLFDDTFSVDDVRACTVSLTVAGDDQFTLRGGSSLTEISRDVLDLVGQTLNDHHQYPDGVFLYTGTMFAPIQDRDAPGRGFTHKIGDVVTVSTPKLGALVNRVNHTDKVPRWTFGSRALMQNLAARGLL